MTKTELIQLLEELLGTLSEMVLKQIDKYHREGMSYKEIGRSVYFLFDVQKKDKKSIDTYGIGLVPHVQEQANKYYDAIKRQREQQLKEIENFKKVPELLVSPQDRNKKRKETIKIDEL